MQYLILVMLLPFSACAQTSAPPASQGKVGGPCEGCEAIYESPIALDALRPVDTLAHFRTGARPMRVSGTVYQSDGRTPAAGVVVYIYHTDDQGVYPTRGDENGWGRRHGYLRGWTRTDASGRYAFYTSRPAPYPGRRDPAHIHFIIKEPDRNEYYIDDVLFEDDTLVTAAVRQQLEERGGRGLVQTQAENGLLIAQRDIYLGKHIEGY